MCTGFDPILNDLPTGLVAQPESVYYDCKLLDVCLSTGAGVSLMACLYQVHDSE